jgi:beta-glucanase (GH16 family)
MTPPAERRGAAERARARRAALVLGLLGSALALVVAAAVATGAATSGGGPGGQSRTKASRSTPRARAPVSSWAPSMSLQPGFVPVARYSKLVQNFRFTGTTLPAAWSAGRDDNFGYQATQFQPSQVSMPGSSVALSAVRATGRGGMPYTSGWISTAGRFSMTYGMIDFRAKMPAGQGLWSGLWLNQPDGSNPWGEIDVQEMLLGNTHAVYGSLHGWAPNPGWAELQSTSMAADASQGFHDYEVDWQPGMITWAIDGVAYAQYTRAQAAASGHPWPFDDGSGFYLIADLAVGAPSEWGGAPGPATTFPATMALESVRIWQ